MKKGDNEKFTLAMPQRALRVVIVDDTQPNLILLRALVSRLDGCTPITFSQPSEGLAWCLREEPDLVIVDYMMPELNGIEFIERLRAHVRLRPIPVLMVTADHEREVRLRALDAGASDFLTRPVDSAEFSSRTRNMLDLRRSHLLLADHASLLQEEVRKATRRIHEREEETIFRLAKAAEFRDPETAEHIQRMANYSSLIGRRLGLSYDDQEALLKAAPMHDIGKLGTPDDILLKPGKLTPDEFEIMKRHTEMGYEILRDSTAPVLQAAALIAWTHHEKFDGTGYPRGLRGDDIPLFGRIVAVADVFDALTSARPYKSAWPVERAVGFIREWSGRHFDPLCVDAFLGDWDAVEEIRARFFEG